VTRRERAPEQVQAARRTGHARRTDLARREVRRRARPSAEQRARELAPGPAGTTAAAPRPAPWPPSRRCRHAARCSGARLAGVQERARAPPSAALERPALERSAPERPVLERPSPARERPARGRRSPARALERAPPPPARARARAPERPARAPSPSCSASARARATSRPTRGLPSQPGARSAQPGAEQAHHERGSARAPRAVRAGSFVRADEAHPWLARSAPRGRRGGSVRSDRPGGHSDRARAIRVRCVTSKGGRSLSASRWVRRRGAIVRIVGEPVWPKQTGSASRPR